MCLTKPTQTLILHQGQSVRTFITSAIAFCVPVSVPILTANTNGQSLILTEIGKNLSFVMRQLSNYFAIRYKVGQEKPRRAIVKHPLKVHAWGAFCSWKVIGFHCFIENMNGELYQKILTENFFSN